MKFKKVLSLILSLIFIFTYSFESISALRYVELQKGDTIGRIAEYFCKEYGISAAQLVKDILKYNNISESQAKKLQVGAKINLPPTKAEYDESVKNIKAQKEIIKKEIYARCKKQQKELMEKRRREIEQSAKLDKQEIKKNYEAEKKRIYSQYLANKAEDLLANQNRINFLKMKEKQNFLQFIINKSEKMFRNLSGIFSITKDIDVLHNKSINNLSKNNENLTSFCKYILSEIGRLNDEIIKLKTLLSLDLTKPFNIYEKVPDQSENISMEDKIKNLLNIYNDKYSELLNLKERLEELKISENSSLAPNPSISDLCLSSITAQEDSIKAPSEKEKTMTIEELVRLDGTNSKYAKYVRNILSNINKENFSVTSGDSKDLGNISNKLSEIFHKIKSHDGRIPYPVQVLTVLRLADEILNNHSNKGTVAEVKAGEGKTFIIATLSIVLAQFGHKIDIVTSTTELAKIGQEEQEKYYRLFNVSSGVLDKKNKDSNVAAASDSTDFNTEVFENQIVYSTNFNLQFVELYGIFSKKPFRTRKYDVVIVDEVDNMILDQAMNPAIIAMPFKIKEAKEILKFVYNNWRLPYTQLVDKFKKSFSD
ncbi:MAG: hypothetical protein FWC41_04160, partial [Firmicutes bacterium]|nr:hypothetical protein [Bacillota bacterium]